MSKKTVISHLQMLSKSGNQIEKDVSVMLLERVGNKTPIGKVMIDLFKKIEDGELTVGSEA